MTELPLTPIRALVLDDVQESGELIASLLQGETGFSVSLSHFAFGEGVRAVRRGEPDVVVLMADTLIGSDPVIAVEEIELAGPNAAIVVLSAGESVGARDFILAGARDCLAPPYSREALVASVRQVHHHESRRR